MTKQNVVLTGFMGTGKTVTGQALAARLGMLFVDTDHEVETAAGLDTSEIFQRYGEERFRSEENLAVARVAQLEGCVIATGGGVVLDGGNMANLRQKGVIILLYSRPEVIAQRLSQCDTRPLLSRSHGQQEQLLQKIETLLGQRALYYENHDFRVDTSDIGPDQAVAEILTYLDAQGWQIECLRTDAGGQLT